MRCIGTTFLLVSSICILSRTGAYVVAPRIRSFRTEHVTTKCFNHQRPHRNPEENDLDSTRRSLWAQLLLIGSALTVTPQPSSAGEVGARITKAVTTSDLGISVRTSVVKGAQVMDQLDGQWEKFSDRFGLGSERSKAGSRPKPKVIPDPLPLDVSTAKQLIENSDRVFVQVSGISSGILQQRVEKIAKLVKVSFERSGVVFADDNASFWSDFRNAQQFNFVVYTHFKAYSELIMEQKIEFAAFRTQFENQLGKELCSFLLPPSWDSFTSAPSKQDRLQSALNSIDFLLRVWKEKGLASLTERSSVDGDAIDDWLDDIADLEFTIALDLDATLQAQILLQEQGFRLYPNFCRYAIQHILSRVSEQKVSSMDYYFDTDYNSDPDLFEAKEILVSIQLETS